MANVDVRVVCRRGTWDGYDVEVYRFNSHEIAVTGIAKLVKRRDLSITDIFDYTSFDGVLPLDEVKQYLQAVTDVKFLPAELYRGTVRYFPGEREHVSVVARDNDTGSEAWLVFGFQGSLYKWSGKRQMGVIAWADIAELVEVEATRVPQPDAIEWAAK